MTKIVRTDQELECPIIDKTLVERGHDLVLLPDGVDENDLTDAVRDAELLLMCYTPITKNVIDAAKNLKAIVKYGVGIDAIDIEAAKARNIPVVNIPEYAERTVAEGAFTLMIALAKKLIPLDRAMHANDWVWPETHWRGIDIAGKTVGLIGAGKIAQSMAQMASAGFGANVIGYSPHTPPERMQELGILPYSDITQMMAECDFVSVHCVLNDETRHLVGHKQIDAMKPSAFLINTARGAIVDEMALLDALQEGRIAGAGLDVYSQEPVDQTDHPLRALYKMDNVILLPHLTFFTEDAMERLEKETLERCFEALEGRPIQIKSSDPRLLSQSSGVAFLKP